jgi:hypothetical protein
MALLKVDDAALRLFRQLSSHGELPIVNPCVDEMRPWNVYNLGRSINPCEFETNIFLQSSNELMTTARVLPSLTWNTEWPYLRHHCSQTVAWSSPS